VDGHELLAHSLADALQGHGFAATPLVVTDAEAARDELLADPPDVVLLDPRLGRAGHAQGLVRLLTAAGVRVLIVSGVTDDREIAATIEGGAVGFVSKAHAFEVLLEAAEAVARGERIITDDPLAYHSRWCDEPETLRTA
jgi:DNA-binding NarL/FixJ family response regulator